MEQDWTEFWVEAQRTSRYFADKAMAVGLKNFEISMYASLCYTLERFYKLNALRLNVNIEKIERDLEQKALDDDNPDGFTSQSSI